ncbi:DUF1003 domain-containing protein [Sphingomonas sp. GlSt437]|uniref:DUF1003 domain-containing protein n=1 Tax=Sphingomonas sp. GlSt437 TaxID=3389970 RepID=UPI003EBF4323
MKKAEERLLDTETALLKELRAQRLQERQVKMSCQEIPLTTGERVADAVAAGMGSWRFIIIQSTILLFWIILNVVGFVEHWDPYPFILLNLALSFQAAYAAPFIMMSQNRQADIDRKKAELDYNVNIKAELEIELLHHKVDELREREVLSLVASVERLSKLLEEQREKSNQP